MVIAQHIPEVLSQGWALRMDRESAIAVAEAEDGDQILIGHACITSGDVTCGWGAAAPSTWACPGKR